VTEIRPFAGVRYRFDAEELGRALAPPYDVITPEERAALLESHPHNAVRLVLAPSSDDAGYAAAGEAYRSWLAAGVLAAEAAPAVYLLEQRFAIEAGATLTRRGLLTRFRAEDPERRVVLPHENTRKAPKADRWRLLQAAKANYSPIFIMFADPRRGFAALADATAAERPTARCTTGDGVEQRLWVVSDPERVGAFEALLGPAPAYIADGHHRYATALRYRDATGPEGAWTLGYFTPTDDPGMLVLPYHRILASGPDPAAAREALAPHFELRDAEGPGEAARIAGASAASWAFGLAWPRGGALVAESRPSLESLIPGDTPPSLRALDPWVFHRVVLDRLLGVSDDAVDYVHSLGEAEAAVASGRCRLAGLMRSTPVDQIIAVAEAGESMPAKSTFFHPKLPSGLVIHPLAL
jgi:uncharacterized protein (DUF1015 family)